MSLQYFTTDHNYCSLTAAVSHLFHYHCVASTCVFSSTQRLSLVFCFPSFHPFLPSWRTPCAVWQLQSVLGQILFGAVQLRLLYARSKGVVTDLRRSCVIDRACAVLSVSNPNRIGRPCFRLPSRRHFHIAGMCSDRLPIVFQGRWHCAVNQQQTCVQAHMCCPLPCG